MLVRTDEIRDVSAVLQFGPHIVGLMSDADRLIYERNQGGEMVEHVLRTVRRDGALQHVTATRGKTTRAEPVAARYEQGKVHHVGYLVDLEQQMTAFPVAADHDDLVDALVWAVTGLTGGRDRVLWGFS